MPDLNTNLYGLGAIRNTQGAERLTKSALQKLSSGLAINVASDGPADLIISEMLRSQIGGVSAAMRNTQEAFNMISVAEGGAGAASDMLSRARALAVQAANTGTNSPSQVAALQTELNGILDAVDRLAGSTRYAGEALLDGSGNPRTFQTGDGAGAGNQVSLDFPDIRAATLGTSGGGAALDTVRSGGANDLATNPGGAIGVIEQAITDLATARGDLGTFQRDTLQANYNSLSVAFENYTAAESSIRDLNFADGVADQILGSNLLQAGIFGIKNGNFLQQQALQLLG
ncbi:MAG TPA: flagellin [Planctomycetota bacterium]|nr:flagellin [Planctomycetota bacterium]